MTDDKESPFKDIEDFITDVYVKEIKKIKPLASQINLSENLVGKNHNSYVLSDLLDHYLTNFKNWKPRTAEQLRFEQIIQRSNRLTALDIHTTFRDQKPSDNPYANGMRIMIQALKSRGLTEDNENLPQKYKECTVKLEKQLETNRELRKEIENVIESREQFKKENEKLKNENEDLRLR